LCRRSIEERKPEILDYKFMRVLNLYLLLLWVIVFTSCSKNDDSSQSFSTYLVKKVIVVDESDSSTTIYNYDKNKLITEEIKDEFLFTYEYTDTSVLVKTIKHVDIIDQVSLYIIKNGLAVKSIGLWPKDGYGELLATGDTTIYHYDSNNHLIETLNYINTYLKSKSVNTWDSNGNLIKTEEYDYQYQDDPVMINTYNYYLDKPDVRDYGLSFRGKPSRNLINTFTMGYNIAPYSSSYSLVHKYTFDDKGRPKKETITSEHGFREMYYSY
jgi:hypothetical protein